MFQRLRVLSALTATMALLALSLPASAQSTPERYRATSNFTGLELRLPGAGDFLKLGIASGSIATDGGQAASADAVGAEGSDASVSSATATAKDAATRDPAEGDNCATPALPSPLGDLIGFGLACSNASAAIPGGRPVATAAAALGTIDVNGSFLADALVDLLLAPLDENLGPAIEAVQDQVIDPVTAAVAEACSEIAAQFNENVPVDPADIIPDQLADVIDALPVDSEEPCVILFELVTNPPGIGPLPDIFERIAEILRDALSGLDLLAIDLGGGDLAITTESGQVVAEVDAAAVSITLPGLGFLTDILDEVLEEILGEFLTAVEDLVAPIAEAVEAIPVIGPLVSGLLSDLSLPLLGDDPLLTLAAVSSSASAIYDRGTGDSSATGNPGTVVIGINPALAALLGTDAEIRVAAGQTQAFAEGTPLESRISVGDSALSDADLEGLAGAAVDVSGLRIELFTGLEGGVVLDVASVSAAVAGVPGTRVDPPGPALPTTGGGLALLALGLTFAATLARRRR